MKQLITIMMVFLLLGCKTKYVEVPVSHTLIEYKDRVLYDSIYTKDSIYIKEKGDTIYINKDKYIYKYKNIKDTINVLKVDSIPVIQTVETIKEVNKLYWWLQGLIYLGIVLLFYIIYRIYKTFNL